MADDADTKFCSNCKRQIASANFLMHEVHCRRNIVLCQHCEEPVPSSELDAHFEEYHAIIPCTACQENVEKCKLESHQMSCPKRSVHCSYCELDMPHCDLQQHEAYCGTRTEPCPLCSQYIMLRDLAQHETSLCTYPSTKPPSQSPQQGALGNGIVEPRRNRSFPDIDNLDGLHNSFAMNELSRILDLPQEMSTPLYTQTSPPDAAASGNRNRRYKMSHAPSGPASRTRNSKAHNKRTNEFSGQQTKPTNMANGSSGGISRGRDIGPNNNTRGRELSGTVDLDQLLAMHLAQDLSTGSYENQEDLIDSLETGMSEPVRNSRQADRSPSPSGQDCLPCEFCGDLFPMDYFIQHQSMCNSETLYDGEDDSPGATSPDVSPPSETYRDVPTNRHWSTPPHRTQPPPQIVDNLSFLAAQDWFSNPAALDADCDVMLPCEFCDNPIPETLLVQHQAVCEGNTLPTTTSATTTSATTTRHNTNPPQLRSQRQQSTRSGTSAITSSSDSVEKQPKRHQTDPTFHFQGASALDESESGASGVRGSFGASTGQRRMRETRMEVGRNGAQGPRPNDLRKGISKPSRQGQDIALTTTKRGHDKNHVTETRSRRGTSTHLRNALDDLHEDRSYRASDLHSFMDKEEKSNRNQRTKEIGGVGLRSRGTGGPDFTLGGATGVGKAGSRPNHCVESHKPAARDRHISAINGTSLPRVGSKPRPVASRVADLPAVSNLRVRRSPKTRNDPHDLEPPSASGSSGLSHHPTRKRTSSRPRKAPQGEP